MQLRLPSLSKPKFFAIPTSPALLLVFFFPLGICTILGASFLCGSHFFCTGVSWGFSGSPVRCLLVFFPQSMQAALAAIISWDARGLPLQRLGPGRGHSSSLAWPEVWVGACGGQGKVNGEAGRTGVALWSLVRRVGLGLGECHFWHWDPNKSFYLLVVSGPDP